MGLTDEVNSLEGMILAEEATSFKMETSAWFFHSFKIDWLVGSRSAVSVHSARNCGSTRVSARATISCRFSSDGLVSTHIQPFARVKGAALIAGSGASEVLSGS